MNDWPLSPRLRDYLEVQYELRRLLGSGGMGAVILANERALDRLVAIKVLHVDKAGDAESRERFRREARAAAKLTHPGIVPLLTFGEVDGELYYVMGYVEGETLAARLERVGRIAPDEARVLLAEVADALAYAHGAGIVHRDLKPENILLESGSGRAVLTDFGIARDLQRDPSLTSTGVIVGTPHYMSPEQASGERAIDGRSDLYSLGVIGYRMVSGTLPFSGGNAREVLVQHLTSAVPPLPRAVVEASPMLDDALRRALAKSPTERQGSVQEFGRALRADAGDDELPAALVPYDGVYARMLLLGLTLAAGSPLLKLAGLADSLVEQLRIGFGGLGVIAVLIAGAHLLDRTRDRALAERKLLVGFRPPSWWSAWWPRRFRRPGDVWERLGRELKWMRNLTAGFVAVALPLTAASLIWFVTGDHAVQLALKQVAHPRVVAAIYFGIVGSSIGFLGTVFTLSHRWRKRRGIAFQELRALPGLSNADPRWRQPRYARILEGPPDVESSAPSLESLIAELGRARVPIPDGLSSALQAVRRAEVAVDRELGALRELVNAEETVRLDRRIAALGHGDPQLRALLESQRALLVRAERRIAELGALRERLTAQERVLRLQLVALRDLAASDGDLSEITGRVRAVNDDLHRLGEEMITASSGPRTGPMGVPGQ